MGGRLQDKVVIITGSAAGIGECMVRRFCAEGARVEPAAVGQPDRYDAGLPDRH